VGWAFNSVNWYKEECGRQLRTSSYRWVGKMDVVDDLKKGYRKEIMVILSRFKDIIGYEDLKRLRIEAIEGYTLPNLNLMPKVQKLNSKASHSNEVGLKGRPIVTGHS